MTDALDIAVNLLWLAPGRVGGSEQYLTRQLAGLPDDSQLAVTVFCQPAFVDAHPALAARFTVALAPLGRDWRWTRIVAEHTWLTARTRSADVTHHGGGTVPVGAPGPTLLTIHDLQYLQHPEYFSKARLAYLRAMMPRSARRASVIATPSGFVRETVVDAYGVPAERVVVVPHGVPDAAVDEHVAESVRRHFRLGERPYLVYPAITHPHKGHATLVDMMTKLGDETVLVLIGGSGAADAVVDRRIEESGVGDRVVRTGRVTDAERDALIAGARAMVFPSEYEGFGAPLVEAMVLGTPVVCGSHPAMREVVDSAAVVVDEPTGEAWADGVSEALARRVELVEAGHARRQAFTVAASGLALEGAYRQAASQ
jgi:alpha-1,3-rhamnosyl/mannosyltransferase